MIEEIRFIDFPWDEMPWARNKPTENRLKTSETREDFPVLILWKENQRVAYLCYYEFDTINIVYVETAPDQVKRGYATELMNEIINRYNGDFDIKAYSTCSEKDASVKLLQKCGFRQMAEGSVSWILSKMTNQTNQVS
jgi:ribosomal protein S18 acetylase RimI-like enzyme